MFIHATISIFLIVVILMQSGRGGGLTEGFASAESMFGAQTNEFMIKATTVFATIFFVTCLGLAILSSQKGKSLMADTVAPVAPAVFPEQTGDSSEAPEAVSGETLLPGTERSPEAPVSLPEQPDALPIDLPSPAGQGTQ